MKKVMDGLQALCADTEELHYKCQMAFMKMTIHATNNIKKMKVPGILKRILRVVVDSFRLSLSTLCEAMTLVTITCNFGRFNIHFPSFDRIRRMLEEIKEYKNILGRSFKSLSLLKYDASDFKIVYQKDTVERVRRKVEDDFKWLGKIFSDINAVLSFSTIITFLFMFLVANAFRKKWCKQVMFQNQYITEEFMIVEARSKKMGVTCILPMQGRERLNYVFLKSIAMTTQERMSLPNWHGQTLSRAHHQLGDYRPGLHDLPDHHRNV